MSDKHLDYYNYVRDQEKILLNKFRKLLRLSNLSLLLDNNSDNFDSISDIILILERDKFDEFNSNCDSKTEHMLNKHTSDLNDYYSYYEYLEVELNKS